MKKIIRNALKCLKCGDVIESKDRHDYVTCSCGNVSVDGGLDYLRRSFIEADSWEDLSEYEDIEEDKEDGETL